MKCPKCVTNNLEQVDSYLICSNCYYKVKAEDVVSHKKGLCVECGRADLTIAAKGMCWSCYGKAVTGKAPKLGEEFVDKPVVTIVSSPVATIAITPVKSSNPLLPPAVECEIALNFDSNGDLLAWLQDNDVTPDHIIELLEVARTRRLRVAS